MKVPFQLRRTTDRPATAVLLHGNAEEVLALCVRLGGSTLPPIHAVAGGFVVRLPTPSEEPFPGAIRLRSLSPGLFVPIDADLVPALLDDEARALVRNRGLVFLPGGRVLSFAPEVVLGPADLLTLSRLPRRVWQPFPERPVRPETLREVVLDIPDPPASMIIDGLDDGAIGGEAMSPPPTAPGKEAAGQALAKLGQGLFWLGDKLNWKGLAKLGAGLIGQALEQGPRIRERLLGKQEAVLRELLRQFREGNRDAALRRALPLGSSPGRGGKIADDANLPSRDLGYRLGDFLGLRGGGPGSIWVGSASVYDELQMEYRKAADAAIQRGDFVRAAVIYGKLLQDWARMAAMLARAGLHHDAALVYLELLHEPLQAAREFEAAGEFDRAVELYQNRGEHLLAGDLLRRIGEDERAAIEFLVAAGREAAARNYTVAARLLLSREVRLDLAEKYLLAGWESQPRTAEAMNCLLELVNLYAGRDDPTRLFWLLDQADEAFAAPGDDHQAGQFYNRVATLARRDHLAAVCDELLDRALVGLARKIDQHAHVGDRGPGVVSMLLGANALWEPSLVRDAEVALRGGRPRPAAPRADTRRLRTREGKVTAVCSASDTGDLFIGFADGYLVHFAPRTGRVRQMSRPGRITGLSCDAGGTLVVLARTDDEDRVRLSRYQPCEGVGLEEIRREEAVGKAVCLTPVAGVPPKAILGTWDGHRLEYLSGPDLCPETFVQPVTGCRTALILDGGSMLRAMRSTVLIGESDIAYLSRTMPAFTNALNPQEVGTVMVSLPWRIGAFRVEGTAALTWRMVNETTLEIASADGDGTLHWARVALFTAQTPALSTAHWRENAILTAAFLGPGRLAGVHADGVTWMRVMGAQKMQLQARTQTDLRDAVACFPSLATKELLVVCRDGDLVRVAFPG